MSCEHLVMAAPGYGIYLAKFFAIYIAGIAIIESINIASNFFLLLRGGVEHVSRYDLADSPSR